MATLTVWKYDTTEGADQAVKNLEELVKQDLIVLEDAATVHWEAGRKKPKTTQLTSTKAMGAMSGTFWGMLFGLIFFVPLLGAAVGAATGVLTGSLTDVGIDDAFINKVRDQVTPGTSALFLMTSDAVVDKVHEAMKGHEGELIFTNLSSEQEKALREVFAE